MSNLIILLQTEIKTSTHVCASSKNIQTSVPFQFWQSSSVAIRKLNTWSVKKYWCSTALLAEAAIWCFKVYKISTKPPWRWEGKGHLTPKRRTLPDLKLLNSNPEIRLHTSFCRHAYYQRCSILFKFSSVRAIHWHQTKLWYLFLIKPGFVPNTKNVQCHLTKIVTPGVPFHKFPWTLPKIPFF